MRVVDRELAGLVLGALREERERSGNLPHGSITQACQTLAGDDGQPLPRRTLFRWLTHGLPDGRPQSARFSLNEHARAALAEANGCCTLAYQWLGDEDTEELPSLRTFQRTVASELTCQELDTLKHGAAGIAKHRAWLTAEVEHRNHIWQADHKQLNVSVIAPGVGSKPQQPWLTYFLDGFSRAIMGWAISLQPNQSVVLAAFRQSILHNPDRGPFQGRPRILYIDHGLEFLADSVIECCSIIGTRGAVLPPYSPQQKGKIERTHRTIMTRFLQGLPAFTGGARNSRSQPLVSAGKPLPLQVLLTQFGEWVQHYNTEHAHRGLAGRSPIAAWEEDATPIVTVQARCLDRYMMRGERRVVRRGKIEFNKQFYIAGELTQINGSRVEVRWDTEDRNTVEVYLDDRHVCTAVAERQATVEQREAYLSQARAEEARLRRDLRGARRRSRRRYKTMVDASAITETTMVPLDASAHQSKISRRKTTELIEHLGLRDQT